MTNDTEKAERVECRLPRSVIRQIEEWRVRNASQSGKSMSRNAAIIRLLEEGLGRDD